MEAQPLGWGRIALGTLFLLRTTPVLKPFGLDFTVHTFPLLGWPGTDWQGGALGLALPAWAVAALCIVRTLGALFFCSACERRQRGSARESPATSS